MICPECGHENRKYAGFCENCQADLRYISENQSTSSRSRLNSNLLLMVALLAVALLIFLFIFYYIMSNMI